MDPAKKKDLAAAYKEKKQIGGVYMIENTAGGKCLLSFNANITGVENRFNFAKTTGSCAEIKLRDDWGDGSGFRFIVVDTMEKKEGWDTNHFQDELKELAELWKEKLQKNWY